MALPGFPSSNFPNHDFDRGFKLAKAGAGGIGCLIVGQMVVGLALFVAVVVVAWHFIARAW
jgi:hypothetical protein